MLTFIWCLFHPCVKAVAGKGPWSLCQKCRWQVTPKHAYSLDPMKSKWTDYATVQVLCGNLSGNKLTCNSSGNTQPQLSELAEPLWIDPGLKSEFSVCDLISTNYKECRRRIIRRSPSPRPTPPNPPQKKTPNKPKQTNNNNKKTLKKILACEEKATTATTTVMCSEVLSSGYFMAYPGFTTSKNYNGVISVGNKVLCSELPDNEEK